MHRLVLRRPAELSMFFCKVLLRPWQLESWILRRPAEKCWILTVILFPSEMTYEVVMSRWNLLCLILRWGAESCRASSIFRIHAELSMYLCRIVLSIRQSTSDSILAGRSIYITSVRETYWALGRASYHRRRVQNKWILHSEALNLGLANAIRLFKAPRLTCGPSCFSVWARPYVRSLVHMVPSGLLPILIPHMLQCFSWRNLLYLEWENLNLFYPSDHRTDQWLSGNWFLE